MFAIDLGNGLTLEGEVKAGFGVLTEDDSPVFDPDDAVNTGDYSKAEVAQKDDSDNTGASLWNEDAGQVLRTRLTFNYVGDLAGARIRLQSVDGESAPTVTRAFGWANFLDKKVVVYGGKIGGDDLWGLGKLPINVFDPSLDGIAGVRVAFNIVDGLSFGFALPFDQVTYADRDNNTWKEKEANRTLGAVFGGAVIGGLYTSDFISAAVGVKLFPAINSQDYGGVQAANLGANSDKKGYGETSSWVEAIVGISVKPIAPLTVVLDAHIDTRTYNDEDTYFGDNKIGFTRIGLKGEYTVIPALKPHLTLEVLLQNDGAERDDKAGSIDPWPQYYDKNKPATQLEQSNYVRYIPVETYGDPSVGLEIGADYTVTETITAYLNIGTENLLWIVGDVAKDKTNVHKSTYRPGAGLYVKPGVKIALGAAMIEIFDKIDRIAATELEYYHETDKIGSYSPVTNQFQVDFNWKF
jgi:hypothetical protein